MDTQLLLKTAMLAGEMMLRSGAETYRVEDTMHHILKTADHIEMAEVLVIMTEFPRRSNWRMKRQLVLQRE